MSIITSCLFGFGKFTLIVIIFLILWITFIFWGPFVWYRMEKEEKEGEIIDRQHRMKHFKY